MQLSFQYGTKTITFNVVYRKRKTMAITVEAPDIVTAIVPKGTTDEVILDKVGGKADWIVQKLYAFQDVKHVVINKEYVNGESFMGRNYYLQIKIDPTLKRPDVKLYRGKFLVTTPTREGAAIRKAMENWYRVKAKEKIQERVKYYQYKVEKQTSRVTVKDQKKRWGRCSSKGNLNFNWRSVMAPSTVLDYIIVHEMCHLVYMNYFADFWNLVESILPDYKERKEWLKKNGVRLSL